MSDAAQRRQALLDDAVRIEIRGAPIWQYVPTRRLAYTAQHAESVEPELLDWIEAFPDGAVFYDLGASNGLFSLYAAIRARARVVAFEPEAQNYATLEINRYLNRDAMPHPIIALNLAISDSRGLGRIYCRRYMAGEHNKILDLPALRDTGEGFEPEHVQCVAKYPLDEALRELGLPKPRYLKIDVDGAELDVLHGAREVLRDPALEGVFIEIHEPEAAGRTVVDALVQSGLRPQARIPVVHPRGGTYPGLYNYTFSRSQS